MAGSPCSCTNSRPGLRALSASTSKMLQLRESLPPIPWHHVEMPRAVASGQGKAAIDTTEKPGAKPRTPGRFISWVQWEANPHDQPSLSPLYFPCDKKNVFNGLGWGLQHSATDENEYIQLALQTLLKTTARQVSFHVHISELQR